MTIFNFESYFIPKIGEIECVFQFAEFAFGFKLQNSFFSASNLEIPQKRYRLNSKMFNFKIYYGILLFKMTATFNEFRSFIFDREY